MDATIQDIINFECLLFVVDTITADIHGREELECTLSDLSVIEADISPVSEIQVELLPTRNISATITIPEVVDGLPYTGEYTVVPDFYEQTLDTKNRRLKDDVTVEAIRVSRTSNPSGGTTVYIGGI